MFLPVYLASGRLFEIFCSYWLHQQRVTVTINGLVKLSAFNKCPYLSMQISSLLLKVEMVAADTTSSVTYSSDQLYWSTSFLVYLHICLLELGTIILDTVCLSESAGRKTPRDEAVIAKLQALRPSLDRHKIFDDLLAIKHNDTASTVMLLLFLYFLALYTFNVLVTVLWLYSVCIA